MEDTIQKGEQGQVQGDGSDAGKIADEYFQNNPLPEILDPQSQEESDLIASFTGESVDQLTEENAQEPVSPNDSFPIPAEEIEYVPDTAEATESQGEIDEQITSIVLDDFSQPGEETALDPISQEEVSPPLSEGSALEPPLIDENNPVLANEPGTFSIPLQNIDAQPIDETTAVTPEVVSVVTPQQEVSEQPQRKIALILSGGGARGAFQVGAEKYAREVKGYHWDIIAGVSVGALNGAMLAMHRYTRLMELWNSISDDKVYTGGFNLVSLVKILFGAKSFYGNGPLRQLMQHEFEAGKVIDELHVGAVSLINGEYVQFTKESLELAKAILASASIPAVWPPVDVSPDRPAMVDGGVRNISPVGDVLDLEPDEIVVINCMAENPPVAPQAAKNVLSIGMRALDIMQNEIFINDLKEFTRINALVQEAEKQGCFLHHPKNGKLLKYYPCQIIEPDIELGGILDFSQKSVQAAIKTGVRRAREVLGRH